MRRVIFNQKGGVGKTSITCNLAAVSASRGNKTLVIDLDTQANSSNYLLGDVAWEVSVADYLDQKSSFFDKTEGPEQFIYESQFENLHVMPASARLSEIEHKLESRYKIFALRKALEQLEKIYDEIYIDTPPALNFFTKAALIGTHNVLIPFDCDAFSKNSLEEITEVIYDLCEDHNTNLKIEGVVVNQFQPRAKLPQQLVDELKEAGHPVFPVMLSSSVKMRESRQQYKPLVYFAPKHNLTQQFIELYDCLEKPKSAKKNPVKKESVTA
jgi:chromosome partitioning protein